METLFQFDYDSNIICAAIHNGHNLRTSIHEHIGLSEKERFFEEDPMTEFFTGLASNRIIQYSSRFEYDLNRNEQKAVYLKPEDCWGLPVYPNSIGQEEIAFSKEKYFNFYKRYKEEMEIFTQKHESILLWDIHSFNNRGRSDIKADAENLSLINEVEYSSDTVPDICIGISNINKKHNNLITDILEKMNSQLFFGKRLSIAVNHPFPGGYFPQWTNHFYGEKVCALSIEFNKRIFMESEEPIFSEKDACFNIEKAYRLREIFYTSFMR